MLPHRSSVPGRTSMMPRYFFDLCLGTLLCAASIIVLLPGGALANIIDATYGVGAGSFERGNFIDGDGSAGGGLNFMGLAPGDATVTGWTVGGPGDGVDWLTTPFYRAADGSHALDLTHTQNSSISTVIPTVPGHEYVLSFTAAAGFMVDVGRPTDNISAVSAGSLVNQLFEVPLSPVSSNDFSAQVFTTFSLLFTATGPTTTIEFNAI